MNNEKVKDFEYRRGNVFYFWPIFSLTLTRVIVSVMGLNPVLGKRNVIWEYFFPLDFVYGMYHFIQIFLSWVLLIYSINKSVWSKLMIGSVYIVVSFLVFKHLSSAIDNMTLVLVILVDPIAMLLILLIVPEPVIESKPDRFEKWGNS